MKPDTMELFVKFNNFLRDNAEFKTIPMHEIISALRFLVTKLERDFFNGLEAKSAESIDNFLKELK